MSGCGWFGVWRELKAAGVGCACVVCVCVGGGCLICGKVLCVTPPELLACSQHDKVRLCCLALVAIKFPILFLS